MKRLRCKVRPNFLHKSSRNTTRYRSGCPSYPVICITFGLSNPPQPFFILYLKPGMPDQEIHPGEGDIRITVAHAPMTDAMDLSYLPKSFPHGVRPTYFPDQSRRCGKIERVCHTALPHRTRWKTEVFEGRPGRSEGVWNRSLRDDSNRS